MPRSRSRAATSLQVRHVLVGDRDADHLHRRQPGRERAGVVLDQDAEEPLDRAEQRPVDHVRALPGAVGGLVLDAEPAGLLEVDLERGHLPAPPDRVLDVHVDLGRVERALALGDHVRQAGLVQRVLERRLGGAPTPRGSPTNFSGRVDSSASNSVSPKSRSRPSTKSSRRRQLVGQLLGRAEDVRVVLGEAADPGQAVHHTGLLVPVDRAELEQPQRQLAVGPPARGVDQDVHRAVHRLGVVLRALHLHRRDTCRRRTSPGGPRSRTSVRLGDVRGVDELVAGLLVAAARVVLHHPPDGPALGVEHRQPAADLGREREQVELGAELAVVALLGLGEQLQVASCASRDCPGGAVDPLQLRVLLAAAPVGAGGAHQLERRDLPGGRQVRPAAQVLPAQLARSPASRLS